MPRRNPRNLLLIGGVAAGAYFFWLKPKLDEQRALEAARAIPGAPPPKKGFLSEVTDLLGSWWAKQEERKRQMTEAKKVLAAAKARHETWKAAQEAKQLEGLG
jgi:hypothetical protein